MCSVLQSPHKCAGPDAGRKKKQRDDGLGKEIKKKQSSIVGFQPRAKRVTV